MPLHRVYQLHLKIIRDENNMKELRKGTILYKFEAVQLHVFHIYNS